METPNKLGALDRVLLNQILADVARMMSEKAVRDYVWIGSVGDWEYRMCVTAYEKRKTNDSD